MPAQARSRYFIEAIDRGLRLMALFNAENPTLSLAEIARRSGSVPSTALRLIQTLIDLDYLEELPETGHYRPSLGALKLGHAALVNSPLRVMARPVVRRIEQATGESVNLAVLVGGDVVLVDSLPGEDALSLRLRPGSRFPAYCTASGKAMLAALPSDEIRRLITGAKMERLGPNTITTLKRLEVEIEAVRKLGFACQDEELAAGIRSVAAAVLGSNGLPVAGISLFVAAARVSLERLRHELAPVVAGGAAELSAKIRAME